MHNQSLKILQDGRFVRTVSALFVTHSISFRCPRMKLTFSSFPFSILNSDQFTFFVGEKKKPIVVHAAAIAEQSQALNTLINGRMKEAQTRSVDFGDVLEEDFIRLCQFAYTRDYTTPSFFVGEEANISPDLKADSTSQASPSVHLPDSFPDSRLVPPPLPGIVDHITVVTEPAEPTADWVDDWGVKESKKKAKKPSPSKRATLRKSFESRSFCSTLPRQSLIDSCEPIANSKSTEDYTTVFLAHARLYVLADKYGIKPLRSLSLHKLHKTLVGFTLYKARIGDVIELARYAYSDDHISDYGADGLRTLVSEYIACEIDTIGKSDKFLSLIEEGGSFI